MMITEGAPAPSPSPTGAPTKVLTGPVPTAQPKRRYDFPIQTFEAIPQDAPRFAPNPHPFRERWTTIATEVEKDGVPRGFYVPASYFVDERGAKPENVNHAYIRQKLSDEWKRWLNEAPAAKRGDRFVLLKSNRTGEEPGLEEAGAGVIAVLTVKKG